MLKYLHDLRIPEVAYASEERQQCRKRERGTPYQGKLDQNIVNLREINPQQSAGRSSPVPTSYKSLLLDQDAGPPLVNKSYREELRQQSCFLDFMKQKTFSSI